MKCPHCSVEFEAKPDRTRLGHDPDGTWSVAKFLCPNQACNRIILFLEQNAEVFSVEDAIRVTAQRRCNVPIRPKAPNRPAPPEVPKELAEDFTEAWLVLSDSPKASAALSRRCLQNVLREAAKVTPGNLADEIQQLLDSRTLPSHLAEAIDGIRNIGNFAAHPMKSQTTGQILPVEPEEAEWNLDVLEGLFDFYFVQPAKTKAKKEALNKKLNEAGKPPMK